MSEFNIIDPAQQTVTWLGLRDNESWSTSTVVVAGVPAAPAATSSRHG